MISRFLRCVGICLLLGILPQGCQTEACQTEGCQTPATGNAPITLVAPSASAPSPSQVPSAFPPTGTAFTPSPPPHPSPTSPVIPTPEALHIPQYHFDVAFDYAAHHLTVTETITYVNTVAEPLAELLLVVEAARLEGVFTLKSLTWDDAKPIEGYHFEQAHVRIPLPQTLGSGEAVRLQIGYELTLAAQNGVLGYSERQTNLGDWYPYVPPYRPGVGWLVYEPSEVGEHLVYEVADFAVEIQVVNAPLQLVIASSGDGRFSDGLYRACLKRGRSFAWSASDEYIVAQTNIGGVSILSYAFPEHSGQQREALMVTAKALALYSELFAPYPHLSLSAVEADFFDGMEYDGLYFLGREYYENHPHSPAGYLTALSAHETAHQWWYGLVGNDAAQEPWLDEALCTYSERLYYERYHPLLVRWWWDYRVDRFDPKGWVNSTIYDQRSYRRYINAVYLQGARFLEDLRTSMGDTAFFALLKDYANQESGSIASSSDFFALLEQMKMDVTELRKLYFHP